MRKFHIALAATAATLAFAAPASAQYYPQPMGYGYGYGGYHGYNAGYGHARMLQARIDQVQREIVRLARYRMLSPIEYRRLRNHARQLERSLRYNARDGYGLTAREAYTIQRQLARLEYRIARDVRDGRRYAYGWRR